MRRPSSSAKAEVRLTTCQEGRGGRGRRQVSRCAPGPLTPAGAAAATVAGPLRHRPGRRVGRGLGTCPNSGRTSAFGIQFLRATARAACRRRSPPIRRGATRGHQRASAPPCRRSERGQWNECLTSLEAGVTVWSRCSVDERTKRRHPIISDRQDAVPTVMATRANAHRRPSAHPHGDRPVASSSSVPATTSTAPPGVNW